jgi:hypothetical protein
VTACALVCLPLSCSREPPGPAGAAADGIIPAALRPFEVVERQERRGIHRLALRRGELRVEIEALEGIEPAGARTLEDDGIHGIRSVYASGLSPYPGEISREIVPDEAFRPELKSGDAGGERRRYFLLFANARHGFGAATRDSVAFRALAGWLYCAPRRIFYRVRCFSPLAADAQVLEELFLGLRCP